MKVPTHLPSRPYVVSADDDAPAVWQLGNLWRVMATGTQTGNAFCLIDQIVTPNGGGPCTHLHTQEEGLYVVSGHCTFNAAGQTLSAGPGTLVAIPRYTEHSFRADGVDTRLLNFYLPAGFEILLLGLSVPAQKNELPPPGIPMPPRRLVEKLSEQIGALPILGLPFADPPREDNMATRPTPGATAQPFISNAETAPSWWAQDGLWSALADGASTDGSYSLFERLLGPGMGEPPHVHEHMDEVLYVLSGEVDLLLADRLAVARSGSLAFFPKGGVHALRARSEARVLNLHTPAGFERIVADLGAPAEARTLPFAGWAPPQLGEDRVAGLFDELGLRRLALADPFGPPHA